MKPNFLVILIDDLRYDEFGAGGHPYMKTPNVDRLADEGALFERAFHTTPICSPNRASIVTGQYASRHGIIDNVARDAMSHRLPNYHLELRKAGYETAHIGKWHMGNDGMPRPGYDTWVSYDGHGRIENPTLNHDGKYVEHRGYITDIMNELAVEFLERKRSKPFSLFFAHKAVHPDAKQAADGTFGISDDGGYIAAPRHRDLYRDAIFPKTPNMLAPADVIRQKPAWAEAFGLKESERARQILAALNAGEQEEIRQRARMMASVDEGVGAILDVLERQGRLDDTFIVFLGDNGYFFGEHGLGPERRFAYEEGIRSPFVVRYPRKVKAGSRRSELVICQDIAPTMLELAGRKPGAQIQGRSLLPLFATKGKGARVGNNAGKLAGKDGGKLAAWRKSFLIEYWAEQAMPWLVGMTYKAVRTDRYKYLHWVNRGREGELDELYDLERDPYEIRNLNRSATYRPVKERLQRELKRLTTEALGLH
jgi:N-acetylglucosamine-6-sulfatase